MARLRAAATFAVLLAAAPVRAGSVAVQSIPFGRAVTMSPRVVTGKVVARGETKVDGARLHYVEIAVEAAPKGTPARPGEHVRLFNEGEWFQHTHAAVIKGGVVSYADTRYATPLPDAQIKPGAAVLVFLRGEAPPPGFPANAVFLAAAGAYERPERAADVARMKSAAFGDPITLKIGEVAVLPDGLEVEIKGHTHKRPLVGGPQKEAVDVEARVGTRVDVIALGHVVDPAPPGQPAKETWQQRSWGPYDLVLVGMKHGSETTLRVLRRASDSQQP